MLNYSIILDVTIISKDIGIVNHEKRIIIIPGDAMNIVFWNTDISNKNSPKANSINDCLVDIIVENNVDLLILAEYGGDVQALCNIVNLTSRMQYIPIPNLGGCERIKGILNNVYQTEAPHEQSHYQILKVKTVFSELIVAMIHNHSKIRASSDKQKTALQKFHRAIRDYEDIFNCQNTIAIGDFNVNPFEIACVSASAMHAIPFFEEVQGKPTRIVDGDIYRKFYNPTWKFFGNRSIPYTTYHYNKSDTVEYYWNAFDQIMIRPSLMNAFDENLIKIISETKNHSLIKKGKPNRDDYSDHLPLFCTLKEAFL